MRTKLADTAPESDPDVDAAGGDGAPAGDAVEGGGAAPAAGAGSSRGRPSNMVCLNGWRPSANAGGAAGTGCDGAGKGVPTICVSAIVVGAVIIKTRSASESAAAASTTVSSRPFSSRSPT